jgi:hypothetical protein
MSGGPSLFRVWRVRGMVHLIDMKKCKNFGEFLFCIFKYNNISGDVQEDYRGEKKKGRQSLPQVRYGADFGERGRVEPRNELYIKTTPATLYHPQWF